MRAGSLAGWTALITVALANAACVGLDCERRLGDPVEFRGGRTLASGSYYETGAWDEPFLHFPAGRSYDLEHDLSGAPSQVQAYLAFTECPFSTSEKRPGRAPRCEPVTEDERGSGVAESAGNQAIFEVLSDERLRVRNDTCAEFYLRIVASTPGESPTLGDASTAPQAGDAGSE